MMSLLFYLFAFLQPVSVNHEQGSAWNTITILYLHQASANAIAVTNDTIYTFCVVNQEILLLVSIDHGKTWSWERIERFHDYPSFDRVYTHPRRDEMNGIWKPVQYPRMVNTGIGMKLDASGTLHLCYAIGYMNSYAPTWLKYATRDRQGNWRVDTLDKSYGGNAMIGTQADLVVDKNGKVHVVYSRDGFPVHAFSSDGKAWKKHQFTVNEKIKNEGKELDDLRNPNEPDSIDVNAHFSGTGGGVGIDIDSANNVHVLLTNPPNAWYMFSNDSGATWKEERLKVPAENLWFECDMTLDNSDVPHLILKPLKQPALHATKVNDKWTYRRVSDYGTRGSIACDGKNNLHVANYDYDTTVGKSTSLLYSVSSDGGVTWKEKKLKPGGATAQGSAVSPEVFISNTRVYINYIDHQGRLSILWRDLE